MLRQQADHGDSRPNRSLADFVAPAETGLVDHIGAFAVAVHGADELARALRGGRTTTTARSWSRRSPTGSPRRWRSGCTSRSGARWYAPDEQLSEEELVAERFRGIRPAFGYPACPDHSEKLTLVRAARRGAGRDGADRVCAMTPAAAVSGIYFGHPKARYFSVGRIGRDQVEDYAARKGDSLTEAERWLRPNLAYDAG